MVKGFGLIWNKKVKILEVFIVDEFKIRVMLLKLRLIGWVIIELIMYK